MNKNFKLGLIVFSYLVLFGCSAEDKLDIVDASSTPSQPSPIDLENGILEISDFIWRGLNNYYYWQESVELLSDKISSDQKSYNNFINSNPNPNIFFNSLIHTDDRFSFLKQDYRELENTLEGIFSTLGIEFGLLRACEYCNDLVGFIKYVHKGSNADGKNIKRGDIFVGVNGSRLNTTNYQSLLFGEQESILLDMAKIQNGSILRTNVNVELKREYDFKIDPIQLVSIINLDNQQTKFSKKVGYIMYNQFIADKSEEINKVFKEFKDQTIDDLILDLRYNGGGSIRNCIELASMITGQFKNQIFAKEQWNKKTETYLIENFGKETILNRFVSILQSGEQINSLNLKRVFIITSSETASASELIINGLSSYIDVIQIGGQTTGKNVASITVYDYIDKEETKNPNHTYAMQPIVLKIANAEGYADYTDGLIPDYFVEENLQNFGSLGSKDEPLLSFTLNIIQNSQSFNSKKDYIFNNFNVINLIPISNNEMFSDKGELFKNYPK